MGMLGGMPCGLIGQVFDDCNRYNTPSLSQVIIDTPAFQAIWGGGKQSVSYLFPCLPYPCNMFIVYLP